MTLHRPEALTLIPLKDTDAKEAGEYVLGPEEVARILDRSPQDVRGLARQGKLRARRMGTRWRFRRDDVLVYLTRLSQIDKSI
jgi:excisionase family DNA binding protein